MLAGFRSLFLEERESGRVDRLGPWIREAFLEQRDLVETLDQTPTICALYTL